MIITGCSMNWISVFSNRYFWILAKNKDISNLKNHIRLYHSSFCSKIDLFHRHIFMLTYLLLEFLGLSWNAEKWANRSKLQAFNFLNLDLYLWRVLWFHFIGLGWYLLHYHLYFSEWSLRGNKKKGFGLVLLRLMFPIIFGDKWHMGCCVLINK